MKKKDLRIVNRSSLAIDYSKGNTTNRQSNDTVIWKQIIDIKSQLLELQSPQLNVKNQLIEKKYVNFEIEDLEEESFLKNIENCFRTKIIKEEGYLCFYSESNVSALVSDEMLANLKQRADDNYFDFEGLPVIEGTILYNGIVAYQQQIIQKNIGFFHKNNSTHQINISELNQTIDILKSLDTKIDAVVLSSNASKIPNEDITIVRRIMRANSSVIFSSKTSSTKIDIDISQSNLYNLSSFLTDIYDGLKDKTDINLNLKIRAEFDYQSITAKFSEKNIKYHLTNDKSKLYFWKNYNKGQIASVKRTLDSWIDENIITDKIELQFEKTDKEKYLLSIDATKKALINNEKLDSLIKTSFCYKKGKQFIDFGTLVKVNYPNLRFALGDDFMKDSELPELSQISPSLKGEKDKVKRLKDALDKFSNSNNALLKELANPELGINDFSELDLSTRISEIRNDSLNSKLNDKQIEAISKSTLASSLFLIQGPPGTGKSTAISEIIWQHLIRRNSDNYKILVTSETNLAVDNAINKLTSQFHMLLKPIRFGSDTAVDDEGQRFLFSNLKLWENNLTAEDFVGGNILDTWVDQIINRAEEQKDELIKLWTSYLSRKNDMVRSIFYEIYLKYCNVIGATSGSIGEKSSTNRDTSFFRDYKEVFPVKKITFDLVVQDESSKSTFPEFLIPCIYTEKAIIIGDHRQLPPMINTSEFIEEFQQVLKHADASKQSQIKDSIQFIKSHREYFDVSFFEKLFLKLDKTSKSSFNVQYRMHPSINNTVSQFYVDDDGLNCGLDSNKVNDTDLKNSSSRYLGQTLFNGAKIVWVNTKSPEMLVGTSRINTGEVDVVRKIVTLLEQDEGYIKFRSHWQKEDEKEIGVITFYGAQMQLLEKAISSDTNFKISVVDRFQGMERNVIIVSLVRSDKIAETDTSVESSFKENTSESSLGFAQSPNRLNVALSRAKRLLIIVGNASHFAQKEIYKNVYRSILEDPNGLVIDAKEFI